MSKNPKARPKSKSRRPEPIDPILAELRDMNAHWLQMGDSLGRISMAVADIAKILRTVLERDQAQAEANSVVVTPRPPPPPLREQGESRRPYKRPPPLPQDANPPEPQAQTLPDPRIDPSMQTARDRLAATRTRRESLYLPDP